jgi:hypothetical protein
MSEPGHSARLRPEIALLLDAARVHLDGDDAARLRARLRADLDWDYLMRMARRGAVRPLLYRSLVEVGSAGVPAEILDRLQASFHSNSLHNLRMTGELLRLLDLFGVHGIAAIPYKGPTLAAMAHGNLAFREFVDLDVLVHKHDLPRARDLLIANGFRPGYPLTPAQESAYVRSTRELSLVRDDWLLVELHVGITIREYGFPIGLDTFWDRAAYVSLAGRDVLTFSAEDLLLILCIHGGRHCWQSLGWICDLAELIRARSPLRWDLVLDQARIWHGERLLLLGLGLANELLRAPLPEPISARLGDDRALPWLTSEAGRWLFSEDADLPGALVRGLFHFRARERWRDGARAFLGMALVPHVADWQMVTLPPSLSFAYSVLRPLRLAWKYGRNRRSGRK